MKNFLSCLLVLFVLLSASTQVFAGCDMCSMYLGMHPNQTKNSIGLRYRWSEYTGINAHAHTNHTSHSTSISKTQKRIFQTAEFWGQWMPTHRLQLLFVAPYSMNSAEDERTNKVLDVYNHIGDIQAIARYLLYRSSDEENNIQQQMNFGFGLKAPTGQYKEYSRENYLDPHIQNGTGSWDVLITGSYIIKSEHLGFNQELNYKINTKNNLGFKFANRFSSASTIFYNFKLSKFSIIPSAAMLLEHAGYDKDQGLSMYITNGTVAYAQAGCDVYVKKFGVNLTLAKPIVEELRDKGADNTFRYTIGINYIL